jgi:hypothetical protein
MKDEMATDQEVAIVQGQAVLEREGANVGGLDEQGVKFGFISRAVPLEEMAGWRRMTGKPRIGDLVVAEVEKIGKHTRIETRAGVSMDIFEGDRIVVAFGNRYATDQYEGYVPEGPVEECDMLSIGGVCGEVVSRHRSMGAPTRLRVLGQVCDASGRPLNTRAFGLPPRIGAANGARSAAQTILVVGSAMNSGKTTTVGTIARSLSRQGYRVAAAKVTGTAAGKDGRYFEACGARTVLDFTSAGYPSTYMLGREELLSLYHALLGRLHATQPDHIVLEIADGVFQRETRMLLESEAVRSSVDHVFFAAGDSLAVESGVRFVRERGLPLRATSGAVTQGLLAAREAEEITGMPCLSMDAIMDGALSGVLDAEREEKLPEAERGFAEGAMDAIAGAADAVTGALGGARVGIPASAAFAAERSA